MVTATAEIERKYEAGPATVLPGLAGLPGVAAESEPEEFALEAEYFDTDDLRLLRAGITLRRRRGGDDEGWHLKLPTGAAGTRTELGLPLGRGSAVPAELARLVRSRTRTARLAPVARIATVRRRRLLLDEAGAALAEVVDDEVSAQSLGEVTSLQRWREVEVELAAGGLELLDTVDDALRAAGLAPSARTAKLEQALADRLPAPAAPPRLTPHAPAGQVVLAYLRAQADALAAADPLVRRDEPEAIHDMRVAARRLRATLQAFGRLLDPAATEGLRAELRWLGQVLGAVRDREVMAGHLDAAVAGLPAELVLGPVAAGVTEYLAPRRGAARRAALRALDSRRYLALLDGLAALLADPPLTAQAGRKAGAVLPGLVAKTDRRLARRYDAALALPPGPDQDVALHVARKAAKRARYAAEAAATAAGHQARRYAKRLSHLQDALGGHQDTVVTRFLLRGLAVHAHQAGDNAFSYGLLYEREAVAAADFAAAAGQARARAAAPKVTRWLHG
jgi:CHAD domain-containing protein